MEYQRLKPIPGVSSHETTAVTMKTIKELLEEEHALRAERAALAQAEAVGTASTGAAPKGPAMEPTKPDPRAVLQQPPHLVPRAAPQTEGKEGRTMPEAEAARTRPPLLARLFGK